MLNRIILIGRLTKDPKLRSTHNGTSVCSFTLAVDRSFKSDNGKNESDFIPIIAWKGLGESCAKYLGKGKIAAVDGRLQLRQYETQDGTKRNVAEVIAENIRFLSPKKTDSTKDATVEGLPEDEEEMIPLDDVPF